MRTGRRELLTPGEGSWALVTGATSGIGAAFARELGRRGYRLMLTGRREQELRAVAAEIGVDRVEPHLAELSDDSEVERLLSRCRGREIDVLINNAGFGIGRPYLEGDLTEELRMEKVHIQVPLRLMHALGAGMVARGHGVIVNVASLAAFAPLPRSASYSSTKAFLVSFSEALAMELRGSGVRVQALCPGFTRTHFHAALRVPDGMPRDRPFLRWMSAEDVVRSSLRALEVNRVVCIPGFWNQVIRRVASHLPRRLYYRVVSKAL